MSSARAVRSSSGAAALSETVSKMAPVAARSAGYNPFIALGGMAFLGGAMATSDNPNAGGLFLGIAGASAVGLGLALGAPAATRSFTSHIGTKLGGPAPATAAKGFRRVSKNFAATDPMHYGDASLISDNRPVVYNPISSKSAFKPQAAYAPAGKKGKWDPRMVKAMTYGMTFSRQMRSKEGQQILFGSGAMLGGNIFNTAYITGNQKNHGYTSQSGNTLR